MNPNNKHIVFLTPGFAQNEQDTTTIPALQEYIRALKKENVELNITIITFQYPFTNEKYYWNNCRVIPLNGKNKRIEKIKIWVKAYQILKKIHKENPISIVHSFWLGECAFVTNLFSKKYNIKHICTLMGQDVKPKNLFLKLLPLHKMNLVCVSQNQQHYLEKYAVKSKLIYWGINKTAFPDSTNKTIDIIGVGSLIPLKKFDLFIDIIYELNKNIKLKVLLIGDGIEKEKLRKKITKLKLENTITLTGLLDYKITLGKISKAKVLLHTSDFESFGMIFPEALESKTKIVSKNVGCVFSTENWLVGETKEEMILACKKALQTSFYEHNTNPFIVENTIKDYLKLYNE